MKNLVSVCFASSLLAGSLFANNAYAWGNNSGMSMDAMNTMNNNMSQPVVRVIRSYPGMFRGWSDNWGFTNQWYSSSSWATAQRNSMMNSNVCIARCMNNMSGND
jgi:hypothetical protein